MPRFRLRPLPWIVGGTGHSSVSGSLQIRTTKSLGSVLLGGSGRASVAASHLQAQFNAPSWSAAPVFVSPVGVTRTFPLAVSAGGVGITLSWAGPGSISSYPWITLNSGVNPSITFTLPGNATVISGLLIDATANGVTTRSAVGSITIEDVTWSSTIPDIPFVYQGGVQVYDLKNHITNFSASLHKVQLNSGSLPSGVTLASDGSGVLTYDNTGTAGTSGTVSYLIVDNADADFYSRRTSPGVIRWFDFNSPSDLGGSYGANFGTVPGKGTLDLDTSVKASGASSLRFGMATNGNSWNWFTNFSSDLSKLYGENTEFYVQYKMRIQQSVLEDWGHKYSVIGSGDDGTTVHASCTDLELQLGPYVPSDPPTLANQFPVMYNACPGSCGGVFPFYESFSGDFKLQNGMGSPFCRYQDATKAGCLHSVADQWMTFQIGVQVGPRVLSGGNYWFSGSRIRVWMQQYPGATEVLIIDWITGTTPGSMLGLCAGHGATGNQKYGKVWLLPYTQHQVASPRTGYVWYDELIISEQKIPRALA